jgi:hypothetical protein
LTEWFFDVGIFMIMKKIYGDVETKKVSVKNHCAYESIWMAQNFCLRILLKLFTKEVKSRCIGDKSAETIF